MEIDNLQICAPGYSREAFSPFFRRELYIGLFSLFLFLQRWSFYHIPVIRRSTAVSTSALENLEFSEIGPSTAFGIAAIC